MNKAGILDPNAVFLSTTMLPHQEWGIGFGDSERV
jgi:hypothetical protein